MPRNDALEEKLLPWVQANYPDMNKVFQQDGEPARTSKKVQKLLGDNMPFWPKNMWPPTHQMPTHWTSLFGYMSSPRPSLSPPPPPPTPNINALKDTVNQRWGAMSEDHIRNGCKAFRGCLEAIIAAKGATSMIMVAKTLF